MFNPHEQINAQKSWNSCTHSKCNPNNKRYCKCHKCTMRRAHSVFVSATRTFRLNSGTNKKRTTFRCVTQLQKAQHDENSHSILYDSEHLLSTCSHLFTVAYVVCAPIFSSFCAPCVRQKRTFLSAHAPFSVRTLTCRCRNVDSGASRQQQQHSVFPGKCCVAIMSTFSRWRIPDVGTHRAIVCPCTAINDSKRWAPQLFWRASRVWMSCEGFAWNYDGLWYDGPYFV